MPVQSLLAALPQAGGSHRSRTGGRGSDARPSRDDRQRYRDASNALGSDGAARTSPRGRDNPPPALSLVPHQGVVRMTDNKLKSLAERIERLMDERDGIQADIRDIYTEAKSNGYVPKVLRKAITRKRMDPSKRDEEDTILELYEGALSGKMRRAVQMAARGATAREIEEETGIDHATVARSVALNKKSATKSETEVPAVPPEGGQSHDRAASQNAPGPRPSAGAGKGRGSARQTNEAGALSGLRQGNGSEPAGRTPSRLHETSGRDVAMPRLPRPRVSDMEGRSVAAERACGGVESRHAGPGGRIADVSEAGERTGSERLEVEQAGVAPGPQDPIDLSIPPFLKGSRKAA